MTKTILDKLQELNSSNRDLRDFTKWFIDEYCTICHECNGSGAVNSKECHVCDGTGVTDGQ